MLCLLFLAPAMEFCINQIAHIVATILSYGFLKKVKSLNFILFFVQTVGIVVIL